jgi:menaquinone-specific isochorismate synthase
VDPFPNALLWVPEIGLHSRQGQQALILTTALPTTPSALLARWTRLLEELLPQLDALAPEPLKTARLHNHDNQPDCEVWRRLVQAALAEIEGASLEKVVLSRRARFVGQRRFDVRRLVTALTYLFPSCQIVELRRGGVSFLAATPERLLQVRDKALKVDAIAGTVRREANAERDAALAMALRRSDKNRREHGLVVDAIRSILEPHCERLEIPEEPDILKLNNVQHLWSPVCAELREPTDAFRLAELLHPTPATNGQPRAAASAWLERQESIERGWYTGAAGYVERNLAGELWVLLRVARIAGETAELFAGAGIVAGSNPASEWKETEDKLSAMLTALQYA